jgi:hypothetical protein
MKQLYIQGIFNEMAGLRDQSVADLNVLLDSTASTGKKGNSKEIVQKIEELMHYDSIITCMQRYFSSPAEAPTEESAGK